GVDGVDRNAGAEVPAVEIEVLLVVIDASGSAAAATVLLSRCCMWAIVSAATSDRRKAQPSSTAMMARSRRPFRVVMSGVFSSAWACFSDSQLPARTPMDLALFTRWMPAASSGASRPLSVASTANLRIADMRTMMLDEPRPRSSRVTRHALTVALVKPGRGSWAYPAEKLVQGHIVDPFRDRRRNRIKHKALHPPPFV